MFDRTGSSKMLNHEFAAPAPYIFQKIIEYMEFYPERVEYLKDIIAECFDISTEQFDIDIERRKKQSKPIKVKPEVDIGDQLNPKDENLRFAMKTVPFKVKPQRLKINWSKIDYKKISDILYAYPFAIPPEDKIKYMRPVFVPPENKDLKEW